MTLEESNSPVEYIWKIHPARENSLKTGMTVFTIIIIGIVSAIFMENIFFGFLALVVMFLGLGSFFFQTEFGVNEKGVVKRIAGKKWGKPWSFFKKIRVFKDGVLLSPIEKDSVLDKYQGWFLPTKDKDIINFIKSMMENERTN